MAKQVPTTKLSLTGSSVILAYEINAIDGDPRHSGRGVAKVQYQKPCRFTSPLCSRQQVIYHGLNSIIGPPF